MKKLSWFIIILLLIIANIWLYNYNLEREPVIDVVDEGGEAGLNLDQMEDNFIKIFIASAVVFVAIIIFYLIQRNSYSD